jgi:hypothetical protein
MVGYEEMSEFATVPTEVYEAVGCEACNNTGYKGRIGVYEAILADKNIENIVRENPSEREIKLAALPQKILNMKQDGLIKILKGVTSFDELERVVDMAEELLIPQKINNTEFYINVANTLPTDDLSVDLGVGSLTTSSENLNTESTNQKV